MALTGLVRSHKGTLDKFIGDSLMAFWNAPLTKEERHIMQRHSFLGAEIFTNISWIVDAMARIIALHHHQKWDGSGYTGDSGTPLLHGKNIPLEARITAVADVYDALRSQRCYKTPMPIEQALEIMREDSGKYFDPDVIDIFMKHIDVMEAIRGRYQEEEFICPLP